MLTSCGKTDSEELVPITINSSVRKYPYEAPKANAVPVGDRPKHETDEQNTGQIKLHDQCAQGKERRYPEPADRESDRPHGADGGQPHDVSDDLEYGLLRDLNNLDHRLGSGANRNQSEGKQDREEHDLQHIAFGEGRNRRMRHDVQEEFAAAETLCRGEIRIDRVCRNGRQIDVHAAARPENIDHDEANRQRAGRHHLEIDQRLDGDPPDAPSLPYGGDTVNHGTKDDQTDKYGDQANKQIAKGTHQIRGLRPSPADESTDGHASENLRRHVFVERLTARRAARLADCRRNGHDGSLTRSTVAPD